VDSIEMNECGKCEFNYCKWIIQMDFLEYIIKMFVNFNFVELYKIKVIWIHFDINTSIITIYNNLLNIASIKKVNERDPFQNQFNLIRHKNINFDYSGFKTIISSLYLTRGPLGFGGAFLISITLPI
jgi:hypothetical protein